MRKKYWRRLRTKRSAWEGERGHYSHIPYGYCYGVLDWVWLSLVPITSCINYSRLLVRSKLRAANKYADFNLKINENTECLNQQELHSCTNNGKNKQNNNNNNNNTNTNTNTSSSRSSSSDSDSTSTSSSNSNSNGHLCYTKTPNLWLNQSSRAAAKKERVRIC